jgi:amidase
MAEVWRMSVTELAALIRGGQLSVREVIDAHLRRVDTVNPSIDAVVLRLDEQALATAGEADRSVAAGEQLPPLRGVPFTIEESLDLVGTPTTASWKALAKEYLRRDAPDVERLKAAGAIPIGRTTLATFTVR